MAPILDKVFPTMQILQTKQASVSFSVCTGPALEAEWMTLTFTITQQAWGGTEPTQECLWQQKFSVQGTPLAKH